MKRTAKIPRETMLRLRKEKKKRNRANRSPEKKLRDAARLAGWQEKRGELK